MEHAVRLVPAAALALVVALGCAQPQGIQYSGRRDQPDTADGLYRVKAPGVAAAFLRPGVSFSGYDSVMIAPVSVSYAAPEGAGGKIRRRTQILDPAAMARFKEIFQESFERELQRNDAFRVVQEPGPNVLRVSGHVVDLVVDVPPYRGGEINYILDAGAMTLVLDVYDSLSGAPLARMADRRPIVPSSASVLGGYRSTPVNNWGAVRDVFSEWARILRGALEELRKLPEVPSPPASG